MRLPLFLLGAIAMATVVAGCGGLAAPSSPLGGPPDLGAPPDLRASSWVATALPASQIVEGRAPWILVDGAILSGSTGCNDMSGELFIAGDRLTVRDLTATKRACPGPVGDQDVAFLRALREVERFGMLGEDLVLVGPSGELVMAPLRDSAP
jgi:heat shock protein HslJ